MDEPIWQLSDVPERIRLRIEVDPVSGCWRYMAGGKNDNVMGHRKVYWEGEDWWVHRLVFTLLVGPIPPGLDLDHVKAWGCVWNNCCWPAHLEPVTHRENMLRGTGMASRNAAKTHCPANHELVPGNLVLPIWLRKGWRICLTCERRRSREAGRAKRAAIRAAGGGLGRSKGPDWILLRWQYGRALLDDPAITYPSGKLRTGVMQQLIDAYAQTGQPVSKKEINARLRCARAYPAEAQVRQAAADFADWEHLRRAGFPPYPAAGPSPLP